MLAFFLTLFLGIAEMFLLKLLLKSALAGNMKSVLIILPVKLVLYGAVLAPVVLLMKESIYYAASGLFIGLPVTAIVYVIIDCIKKNKAKGDDSLGHDTDN